MVKAVRFVAVVVAALLSGVVGVRAQNYPDRAINLVIPYTPGDAADIAGRTMSEELAKLLKVPVVPMNKPGGSATIGTDSVAKAKKDGYTILFTTNAALISARIINPENVPYDPFKDLTVLGLATRTPVMLAVRSDAPYKNFRELIDYAKKNPGKVRVGTVGVGSVGHFTLEIINNLTGAEMIMVPFKGASPTVTALLGGHVEGAALATGVLAAHLKNGSAKGMVISSKSPEFPEVPMLTQLGYQQNLLGVWFAFLAPAGIPAEVTNALVPTIEKAVKDFSITSKLAALGMVQSYETPEKLLAEMREEYKVVEEIAKKSGLVK
jgi:tripartite-type tricarboxylate transporter receptor subunit TctC